MKLRMRSTLPVHELAICEAVLRQVLDIAAAQSARHIGRITLHIGPLAGVEPELVRLAFPLVAAGTACEACMLEIEFLPVQVCCQSCGTISDVPPNRLLCGHCSGWRVDLVSGDELLLARVELLDHAAATVDEGFR
jgi:hydrogenase nickel incorporation protein HypA/HybF